MSYYRRYIVRTIAYYICMYMYEYEPTKVSILSKVCTSEASMHIGVEFVDMVHVYSNIYSIVDMHIYI